MGRLNPKHTTMLQRLGFQDQDLTTAAHDEILFWLSNKERLLGILRRLIPAATWTQQEVDRLRAQAIAIVSNQVQRLQEERTSAQDYVDRHARKRPASEYDEKRIAGYASRVPALTREIARLEGLDALPVPPSTELQIDGEPIVEYPLRTNAERNPMIVGYADLLARCSVPRSLEVLGGAQEGSYVAKEDRWRDPRWSVQHQTTYVLFEVKTEIRSFGELMRQLQTYRTYFQGIIAVVCPDERFGEQLESQGIRFVHAQDARAEHRSAQGTLL